MSCISQALPASCNLNPQCICSDAAFISTISCCVSTACDTSGQQAALSYAKQICAPVGVTNLVSVQMSILPKHVLTPLSPQQPPAPQLPHRQAPAPPPPQPQPEVLPPLPSPQHPKRSLPSPPPPAKFRPRYPEVQAVLLLVQVAPLQARADLPLVLPRAQAPLPRRSRLAQLLP